MCSLCVIYVLFLDGKYVDVFLCTKMNVFFTLIADNCLTKKIHLNRKNRYTLIVVIASVVFVLVFTGYITVWITERRNKSDAR